MANTKVTGDLIASGTITAANLVSGTLDTLLNNYLTTNTYATQGHVTTAVNNLIDAAPASLDTLNELAAALNDDANFATTVTNSLATKLNLSGGTLTGDLGIGTSPSAKLDILGATQDQLRLRTAGTEHYRIGRDSSNGLLYFYGSQSGYTGYVFDGVNGERMRIDSSGNVGIGTSSPTGTYGKLTVNGSISLLDDQNTKLEIGRYSNAAPNAYIKLGANANSLRVTNNIDSVDIFNITNSGDVSIGTTSPLLTNPGRGSLTINGSADAILTLGVGGAHKAWFYHTASANNAYLSTVDNLAFEAGSSVRMYLASGGNVGINTTSPSQQLHVNGVTLSQGLYIPGLTTLPNTQGAIQADIPSTSYNAFRLRDTATGSSHTIHGFASNWSGGVSPGHLNLEGITAVSFGTWVGPNMIIHHSTGNVGIGIGDSTPDGRLTISAGAENQTAPVNAIRIKGPNVPSGANSSQNISWDFSYAGSAKIRANRGASWGTQIDFLTNTSSQGSDNPGVKLSILDNGGITFNGDTAAANALDDYEEGSWSPQVYYQNATDQSNATNTVQEGKYTKIGNLVYVSFRLDFSQSGSPSNDNIGVKNLPFAGANNHYNAGGNLITSTSFTGLNFSLPTAGSTIAVIVDSSNGGNYGDDFGTGSGKYIRGSFTYLAQ